jgi:hypothetical protein
MNSVYHQKLLFYTVASLIHHCVPLPLHLPKVEDLDPSLIAEGAVTLDNNFTVLNPPTTMISPI